MKLRRNQLLVGDVRRLLPRLPTSWVDCVITSPPFYRLRDYGQDQQIGLEPSVDDWVGELRRVLRDVARVLKPSGSVWVDLGDSFSNHERDGALPKSLLFGPERLALAMVEDGWVIRSKVVWSKSNPMPTSARDRLSCTWEVLYFAVRSNRYYFDLDAIRVPHRSRLDRPSRAAGQRAAASTGRPDWAGPLAGSNSGLDAMKASGYVGHRLGKNPGDVWRLPTSNYRGAHHATFPVNLIRRPLLASCPERVCEACGQPWERARARTLGHLAVLGELQPQCACGAPWQPGLVLDPFMGSGTVAVAAEAHRRDWLGIELNPEFAALARQRIAAARKKRGNEARVFGHSPPRSEEEPMTA
jgi:site-specific DNA-methyltransferase (adenine-specific)